MKTKSFFAFVTLALSLALSLAAAAKPTQGYQQNQALIDAVKNAVKLQCTVGTPVEFPKITITNNTSNTVPQGKTVHWFVNTSMKGSLVLQNPLAPGQKLQFDTEARGNGGAPSAWYFK